MLLCDGLTYVDDDGKKYSLGVLDSLCGNTSLDVVVIFDNMVSISQTKIVGWFYGASEFNNPNDTNQMQRLNELCYNTIHKIDIDSDDAEKHKRKKHII